MRVGNYFITKLLPHSFFFLSLHQNYKTMETYTIYLLTTSKTLPKYPIRSFFRHSDAVYHLRLLRRRHPSRHYVIYRTKG